MKKKRNIYLAIFTLITILCWITFTVLRTYEATTITPDVIKAMTPLNPNVDEKVFQQLEQRAQISAPTQ